MSTSIDGGPESIFLKSDSYWEYVFAVTSLCLDGKLAEFTKVVADVWPKLTMREKNIATTGVRIIVDNEEIHNGPIDPGFVTR